MPTGITIAFSAADDATEVAHDSNRLPTTAWAGFPPGPPKPGHRWSTEKRTQSADCIKESAVNNSTFVQPNAHNGPRTLFRLGVPGQGILFFHTRSGARIARCWSQKDAPMAWVGSPPLIRPSRGVLWERPEVGCQRSVRDCAAPDSELECGSELGPLTSVLSA